MAATLLMTEGFKLILDIVEEALLKGNSKQAVINMIEDFANGKDSSLGDIDNRLSSDTIALLKKLIENGTIERLVENMYKSSIIQKILRFLFPCLYRQVK